jgi:hypothetical protein
MQRSTALLFAAALALVVGLLLSRRPAAPSTRAPGAPSSMSATTTTASTGALVATLAAPSVELPDAGAADEPIEESDAGGGAPSVPAPTLAADAPKSVTFGVILVTYRGAQGAPAAARTKADAETLAREVAALARQDFKAALAKGDKESLENAGRMPRGMLEPAPEAALFSLAKGAVSDPVDTPRGFWILKRHE